MGNDQPTLYSAKKSPKKLSRNGGIIAPGIIKEERGKDLHLGMAFLQGLYQDQPGLVFFMGVYELKAFGFQMKPGHLSDQVRGPRCGVDHDQTSFILQ